MLRSNNSIARAARHFSTLLAGLFLVVGSGRTQTGSAWLEMGSDARSAALGEAVTASPGISGAAYWNPAAAGQQGGASISHADGWMEGSVSQFVSVHFHRGPAGIAISALHYSVQDLQLRSGPSSEAIGRFDASSYALGASVSYELLARTRFGLSGRFLNQAVYLHSARGWSMDAGVLHSGLLDGSLDVGATLRHLGEMDALLEQASDLPTSWSVGAHYRLREISFFQPSLMADLVQVRSWDPQLRMGVEGWFFNTLALRGGYETGRQGRGLTLGLGVRHEVWDFQFAYTPYRDDLGATQRLGVAVSW